MVENENSDLAAARERYRIEREKRLRDDAQAQYSQLAGEYKDFDIDPWVEPGFEREPVTRELDAVIVGAGFGGMMNAINLRKRGITDFVMVEKAGDVGGTWYWNRYPGCQCDVESYIYMPFLEETGYMPKRRYAPAPEIFEHCQRIAKHFDLYQHALFQTEITDATWNDETARWTITTTRGDTLTTKFFILAGGILHKAKLPAIEGITDFEGRAFHTARWDYDYTGGSPTEPMDKLSDKVVGVIGTGATAIQVVPQLAKSAKDVYVFQRTPAAVGVRDNRDTDPEWFNSLEPGWQRKRILNFTEAVTGEQPEEDLVRDGWTDVWWTDTQVSAPTPEENAELERIDFEAMEKFRARVDDVVEDPETAEKLKAYYGKHCKRLCFHDEYLQSFNLPNVHLVDTDGKGVRKVDAAGPIVDGKSYPLDMLVYASGFEVTQGLVSRMGFDPVGRGGTKLSERWDGGAHTLHGILSNGFPNMLVCHFVQAGFGLNFTHYLGELTNHVSWIVSTAIEQNIDAIEPTIEAEDEWLMTLWKAGASFAEYSMTCTPSYNNSEGAATEEVARGLVLVGNLMNYSGKLKKWREAGDLPGTITKSESAE